MDKNVLSEIAYLDDFTDIQPLSAPPAPADMVAWMHAAIELEMAKQGHQRDTKELSRRLASLELRVELMVREFARQRGLPAVQYVVASPTKDTAVPLTPLVVPKLMIVFYILGLVCSVVFAALLALSGTGTNLIHPFVSLLGLVGGLGWLTTAWADLLLWKRENPIGNRTTHPEETITTVG